MDTFMRELTDEDIPYQAHRVTIPAREQANV